jgi:4-hydroxyacetophenone monooxygenase
MVWTHRGTDNWYRNSRGRVVAITPWRNDDFWRMTRQANPDDFVFETLGDGGKVKQVEAEDLPGGIPNGVVRN